MLTPKKITSNILLTLLILSPIGLYFTISYTRMTTDPNVKMPWVSWYDDPHQRVYVSWETEELTQNTIKWDITPINVNSLTENNFTESVALRIHHVNLTGLLSNTQYYYQIVGSDGNVFGSGQFKTAPADSITPFTWGVTSDTQQPKITEGNFGRIVELTKNKNYSFFANVGDLTDTAEEKSLANNYFTTAAPLFESTPFIPVMGNHDMHGDGEWFYSYFVNHENRDSFYYSFNYSMMHVSVLSFGYANPSEFSSEQMAFIEEDLQNASNKTFKVVMLHCPVYGSGLYGPNENLITLLEPLLIQNDVSLVLQGHEHHYERTIRNGITYMVLGGGGGALDPGLHAIAGVQYLSAVPSYTEINVDTTQMHIRTFGLDDQILDQAIISAGGINL